MKIIEQAITFSTEKLKLTNQRALYWPDKNALLIADLHLGKAGHFRKHGIAMPTQVSSSDINRLEVLIQNYQPAQVIIVGDLIHAGANKELKLFKDLKQKYKEISFVLVKGNHDRVSADLLFKIGITEVYEELSLNSINLVHHYNEENPQHSISGHLHPGIGLQLPAKKYLKFPCFVVTENRIILPAFSLFTGLDTRKIFKDASYYAFYEEGFFKI